jgi:CRISPR-associated protein (TIGR03984 family)
MLFYPGKNLEIEYLQSLRVFNNSRELYLWKGQDGLFTGRLRVDGVGEDHEYVEAEQVMSGTRAGMADGNGGWSKVEEERGVEYFLPCKLNSDLRKNPVRIRTRSYIGYLGNGQASYVDARLVDFCGGGI